MVGAADTGWTEAVRSPELSLCCARTRSSAEPGLMSKLEFSDDSVGDKKGGVHVWGGSAANFVLCA